MADRTIEFILKLTTQQFRASTRSAQQATKSLGDAAHNAVMRGVNPLNIRLAATTAGSREYAAALQGGATAADASARAAQAAASAVEQLGNAQGRALPETKSMTASLADVYQAAMSVRSGYDVVAHSVSEFIAVGERAAQRERTGRMFRTLSGGAEHAARNLDSMRRATRFTISEAEAMESAVRLLGMRLAKTPEELAQITQQVASLGGRFAGFSADRSIQQFMFAIENQSLQRLGEFGLNVTDVTRRVEELTQAGYAAEEAFKMAVLEGLDEQFTRVGGAATDSATAFEEMNAALDDLRAYMEEQFLPASSRVAQAITDIARLATGFYRDEYGTSMGDFLATAEGPEEFAAATRKAMESVDNTAGRMMGLQHFETFAKQIRANADSFDEYSAGMAALNDEITRYNQQLSTRGMGDMAMPLYEPSEEAWRRISQTRQSQATQEAENMAAEREVLLKKAGDDLAAIEEQIAEKRKTILDRFQEQAVDRERQRGRESQLAALRSGWALADAEERIAQQRARIATAYHQASSRANAQHLRRIEDIERQHAKRLRDIQFQYVKDVWDATMTRDAVALFRARQRRDEETMGAEETRQEQQRGAEQQRADAIQAAQQQQAEQQRILEESLRRESETRRRAADREQQERAFRNRWAEGDRHRHLQQQLATLRNHHDEELREARRHFWNMQMYDIYNQSPSARRKMLSGPTVGAPEGDIVSRASGGYVPGGLARLHPGEFVLNPQTTRRLEGVVGGSLTQQNVLSRGAGGPQIAVPVTIQQGGMGSREVARVAGDEVTRILLEMFRDVDR